MSNIGGAWSETEIDIYHTPSWFELEKKLKECTFHDYVLIVFSGHGCEDKDGHVRIALNSSYINLDVWLFWKSYGVCSTTIIDACRGIDEGARNAKMASTIMANRARFDYDIHSRTPQLESFSSVGDNIVSPTPSQYQEQWFKYLKCSQSGHEIMYSCSSDESAGEDPDVGGYYTTILLSNARNWASRDISTNWKMLSSKEAHDGATLIMQRRVPDQHPIRDDVPYGNINNIPFCIK